MEEKRIKLYQKLKESQFYSKSYNEFINQFFNNSTNCDKLYDACVSNGSYTKTKKEWYKSFACDLTWASTMDYCGTVTPAPSPNPAPGPAPSPNPSPAPSPNPVPAPGPRTGRFTRVSITGQDIINGEEVSKGMKGNIVEKIQEHLNRHGATPILIVDGKFGDKTEKAVKQFQKSNSITDTGIVDDETYKKLLENSSGATTPIKKVEPKPEDEFDTSDASQGIEEQTNYMDNKYSVSNEEKMRILESHNKYRKLLFEKKISLLLNEDEQTERKVLDRALTLGCNATKNGKIVKTKSGRVAIRKEATTDSAKGNFAAGDTCLFYGSLSKDGQNYEAKSMNPNTKAVKDFVWNCKEFNVAKSGEFQKTAADQEIKAGNWMTFDEARTAGVNLSDPKFYEQKKINGVDYFRKKGVTVGGAGSQEQSDVVDFLTNRYGARYERTSKQSPDGFCWAFQGQEPLVEPKWNLVSVVGGAEYGVEQGLKVFVSPACLKDVRKASKTVVSTEAGQRRVDNKGCKETIDEYLQAYEDDVDTTSTAFQEMKRTVIACKRKFCNKNIQKTEGKCEGNWNLGLMGGSRRVDDIIDFFSGEENGIGTSPSRTNPFRIA